MRHRLIDFFFPYAWDVSESDPIRLECNCYKGGGQVGLLTTRVRRAGFVGASEREWVGCTGCRVVCGLNS